MISKIQEFFEKCAEKYMVDGRRFICLFLPGVIPVVGTLNSLVSIALNRNQEVAERRFFAFFLLWVLTFVWYLYAWVFANKLGARNVKRGLSNYLNGDKFWHYENGGFLELGRQMGHGLCYEAAAMLMLVWRDHENTRFVYGEAYSDYYHDTVPHAWMEIKAYGIWWVIDAGWYSPAHPIPRLWYLFINRAKVQGMTEHREFFGHKNARILAEAVRKPSTSMCLHKLSSFSRNLASLD